MKKAIITLIVIIIIGYTAFTYFTRKPSAPSTDISTVPEQLQATTTEKLYRISSDTSIVSFKIDEILNNKASTAIGTTSQIAGDIKFGKDSVTMGTIAINAKTFKTGSEKRDGAITRAILKSEDPANEFIYFKPAPISGLPSLNEASSTLAFTVMGDLTISGVTKQIPFAINLKIEGSILSGIATAKIKRSDFKLVIPSVPLVASVDDEFTVSANISAQEITQ
ncbi:MAG: YceI family protein [Patescibacteria group bacterium]